MGLPQVLKILIYPKMVLHLFIVMFQQSYIVEISELFGVVLTCHNYDLPKNGSPFIHDNVTTVKHDGGSILTWGCFDLGKF